MRGREILALIEVGGDSGIVQLHTMSEKVYFAFNSFLHSFLGSVSIVSSLLLSLVTERT
jgi:hypothetical protein